MDPDDLLPRKADELLSQLENEDLAAHSLDELQERIRRLEREILRVRSVILEKDKGRAEAEAAFKS